MKLAGTILLLIVALAVAEDITWNSNCVKSPTANPELASGGDPIKITMDKESECGDKTGTVLVKSSTDNFYVKVGKYYQDKTGGNQVSYSASFVSATTKEITSTNGKTQMAAGALRSGHAANFKGVEADLYLSCTIPTDTGRAYLKMNQKVECMIGRGKKVDIPQIIFWVFWILLLITCILLTIAVIVLIVLVVKKFKN